MQPEAEQNVDESHGVARVVAPTPRGLPSAPQLSHCFNNAHVKRGGLVALSRDFYPARRA
jgi:hypothetical protein